MIYVTGDTHGNINFSKLIFFANEHQNLTKNDYVIIAGDFGAVWDKETLIEDLTPYQKLPFTILFVDGNHENFDMLNKYPVEMWNGGKVHKIKDDIIHLMRGQVFELEGKKIFTFGGATSIDRYRRQEGISWWEQEKPDYLDLQEAIDNLKMHNNEVDIIITHSCDEKALYYSPLRTRTLQMGIYPENQLLSYFEENVKYNHWYFGHYHLDGDLNESKTVLFETILKI